ncbi:restriction endonuclease subunit S [Cohnella cholangitidis]|uniref:Restriction endonuclease subunit S n=1 Tax=Cohnella cholangitidis TaxID=2598458 RepID=A0A7G5BWI5_9BACL|nr:restriction endonuclease subunit S [Cohnella cholangitidis]QMV41319.1 restriction endonuclease subunit S [Cohnella cholangitidis]
MMTEHKQKLVPAIRFNAFTDTWEQRKLSDVADYYDGTHQTPKYTDEGVKFISVENIKNIWESDKYISENDYEKQFKIKPQINDIFMTRITAGVIGDTALVEQDDPLAYYVSLALIRPKSIVPLYLEKYINSPFFKNELHIRIIHTAFPKKINLGDIGKCGVKMPNSKKEQVQIGEFFKQFDNLIFLHQRKLDGLVTLKDGFLQQMFPAANEVIPRVRFAGFTGNWEKRRLEEMLTERNEQFEESEDYPLMSFVGNVGVVPKGEQYDRSFLVKGDGKKYKKTELNDFIYSSNNLETGSIGLNRTGKAVISPVYSIFYSSNDSESLFVGLLSKRKDFINKMIHYRQGVMYGQWRIHERDFLKIIVLAPTISEQNRIIDFFKNFDEQIAAQTAKLEQLRQLKAAYIQRMFI